MDGKVGIGEMERGFFKQRLLAASAAPAIVEF
jgi:hypothetical protein